MNIMYMINIIGSSSIPEACQHWYKAHIAKLVWHSCL